MRSARRSPSRPRPTSTLLRPLATSRQPSPRVATLRKVARLALTPLPLLAGCGGGSQTTGPGGGLSGLWIDSTGAYALVDQSHTWSCSTAGYLYLVSSTAASSVSSNTIACTTPIGNNLSWAGGTLSNMTQSGGKIAFAMSAGVFDTTQTSGIGGTGCQVTTSVSADAMTGAQTCTLRYVDPFGLLPTARATVQGHYGAKRASFGPDLPSVGCAQEGKVTPQGLAAATIVLFQNNTGQTLAIIPVDSTGQRSSVSTPLPPGSTVPQAIPVSYPLVLADASGACRGVYVSATLPAKAVMP